MPLFLEIEFFLAGITWDNDYNRNKLIYSNIFNCFQLFMQTCSIQKLYDIEVNRMAADTDVQL